MSQQINLINPALIKKKDFFTTANIGLTYVVACCLLLAWYGYQRQQTQPLITARDQADQQLVEMQERLRQMQLARQPKDNAELEAKVQALLQQKKQQADLIVRIAQSGANDDRGVPQYMRGLARQTIPSVWLTGFSLDSEHRALSLKGRTLNADALPHYIQKLGEETVFSGQAFGGLQVSTPIVRKVDDQQGGDAEVQDEEKAAYVEFELKAIAVKDDQSKEKVTL